MRRCHDGHATAASRRSRNYCIALYSQANRRQPWRLAASGPASRSCAVQPSAGRGQLPSGTVVRSGGVGDDAVAAGKAVFSANGCEGCHNAGGTVAGVGPKLAGAGLAEDTIKDRITNGRGAMPPGLATGDDLENVTKFVLSLQ